MSSSMWPDVPESLKYESLNLPGTFRELASDGGFTHDDIGRIVRCLALDTDLFVTMKIEPEVRYYRKELARKSKAKAKVYRYRERKRLQAEIPVEAPPPPKAHVWIEPGTAPMAPLGSDIRVDASADPIEPIAEPESSDRPAKAGEPPEAKRKRRAKKAKKAKARRRSKAVATPKKVAERLERDKAASAVRKDLLTVVSGLGDAPQPDAPDNAGPAAGQEDRRLDAAWIPQRFEVFWARYPRKEGKDEARRAFSKVVKEQRDVDRFMATAMSAIRSQSEGGSGFPDPATWLETGAWTGNGGGDETSPAMAGRNEVNELLRRMQGRAS